MSQWNPHLDHTKRNRRWYRLEKENVDEKYVVTQKKPKKVVVISGSQGLQITELQDLHLGVVM